MALGLRPFSQRTGDGAGAPVLDSDNGEELMHVQSAVSIVLGNRPPESPGTLYISTHQVIWLSDVDRSKGYAVDFLSVSLHAVSRDPEAYPSPCIYTQIESQGDGEESEDSDSECSDPLDLSKITEMRLVPSDPNQLETLFQIFCECAELNPEPSDEEDGDEVGHNWVFNVGQLEEAEDSDWNVSHNPTSTIGYSNGDHDLVQNVHQLNIDDQRFEDAEEMEHEGNGGHQ